MKPQKIIFTLIACTFTYTSFAQVKPAPPAPPAQTSQVAPPMQPAKPGQPGSQAIPLDPTGKRFMKPRERTKYGGPVHSMLKIEKGPDNVNITFAEIQIDPSAKGGYDVTLRGTKTPKLKGCDDCSVAGRIMLDAKVAKEFETAVISEETKAKQTKNAAASRVVSYRSADDKVYSVVTNPEGGFMMTTIPNGTYSIWVGGKKVVTDFVLTTVEVKEEDLKKEAPKPLMQEEK